MSPWGVLGYIEILKKVDWVTFQNSSRPQIGAAHRLVIIDSRAPLPWNGEDIAIRLVEATFGHEHHHHFRDFLATGGIMGAVHDAGLSVTEEHRSVFLHRCREAVVLGGPQRAA